MVMRKTLVSALCIFFGLLGAPAFPGQKLLPAHQTWLEDVSPIITKIEREVFLSGHYKALLLAMGPCGLCDPCPLERPCRHPNAARPAMEACGIDVYETARRAGFPLQVVTSYDDTPNYYSLLLVE